MSAHPQRKKGSLCLPQSNICMFGWTPPADHIINMLQTQAESLIGCDSNSSDVQYLAAPCCCTTRNALSHFCLYVFCYTSKNTIRVFIKK